MRKGLRKGNIFIFGLFAILYCGVGEVKAEKVASVVILPEAVYRI